MRFFGMIGVAAAAVLIAAVDLPKFDGMENEARHKAVYFTLLTLFVVVGEAAVWTRVLG